MSNQNKTKINLVTFHRLRSYGAVLHTYALTKALQSQGYDVSITNSQQLLLSI
jgi:hypothetical protein